MFKLSFPREQSPEFSRRVLGNPENLNFYIYLAVLFWIG